MLTDMSPLMTLLPIMSVCIVHTLMLIEWNWMRLSYKFIPAYLKENLILLTSKIIFEALICGQE